MAAPVGPKKVHRYTIEFKIQAVRLSLHPEIQTQDVAHALDIHPFMLSRWRKQARDGVLRGKRVAVVRLPPPREIRRLQALERAHALLQEEHALLKKAIRFWAARKLTSSRSSTRNGANTG